MNSRIFRLASAGIAFTLSVFGTRAQNLPARYLISTLAGESARVDGIPARSAYLAAPGAIAVAPDRTIYFGEDQAYVIRKVTPQGIILPVAGNGSVGHTGDNGPALAARIGYGITGIVLDNQGSLYFADTNATVRKVNSDGIITRFAGTGQTGFSGDGDPATEAQLGVINTLAIDAYDQLYIATADNRVRRVSPDGTIQTIAGTGEAAHTGDGGPAVQAALDRPVTLAVDGAGNLFIGEASCRIRRVSTGGEITTVAGTGSFGLSSEHVAASSARLGVLRAMAASADGTVYFTEESQNQITGPFDRVRKLTRHGKLVTVAGGRGVGSSNDGTPAREALLGIVGGLALDGRGDLFFTDFREHRIQSVNSWGTVITVAGLLRFGGDGGPARKAVMNAPSSIVADASGNVYVGEAWGLRIRKITPSLTIHTFAGNGLFGYQGDGLPAKAASFAWLNDMAFLADGSLLVADFTNHRVRRIDSSGIITTFAGNGTPGGFGDGGPATNAQLTNPFGIAVDPVGNVYISETFGHRIRKVTPDGTIITIAGNGKPGYAGDGNAAQNAQLAVPRSLTLDAQGNLYVADSGNFRIRRISPDGIIQTVAGNGQPGWTGDGGPATDASIFPPFGAVVDSFGAVLFTGAANSGPGAGGVVRRLRPDGTIDTIAGTGDIGAGGDGGIATNAQFNFPSNLALDSSGHILVIDRFNHRVRLLTPVPE